MPTSNKDLIAKADMTLADLASNGGLLSPEQTDRFIRVLIDSPTMLNSARVVTMSSPSKIINKIGFGSRVLRPATSATPLSSADRAKATTGKVTLNTKEVIAEVRLPYDVLEDNIEGGNINADPMSSPGGLHSTIVEMLASRASLDLEEMAILGDTSNSSDPYLAMHDGFLKMATAHVVDCTDLGVTKDIFKQAIINMPDKYLRVRSDLNFFVSVDNETEYRDTIANRVTGLGDSALVSANGLAVFGSPIVPAPLMPNASGIYTNPNNLIFGIQRKINLEYDKDIRSREFIIVLTARIDFQIEEVDAIVKLINIGAVTP